MFSLFSNLSNKKIFKRSVFIRLLLLFVAILFVIIVKDRRNFSSDKSERLTITTYEHVEKRFNTVPLHFEKNCGQTDHKVEYLSRGSNYSVYLMDNTAILELPNRKKRYDKNEKITNHGNLFQKFRSSKVENTQSDEINSKSSTLSMQYINANQNPHIIGLQRLRGKSNYFFGKKKEINP